MSDDDHERMYRIADAIQAFIAAASVVLFFVLVIGAVIWGARQ